MENTEFMRDDDLAPGDKIRLLRKRAGLTLNEVSLKTGLAVSTLSKLEKGKVSLSYDKLMLLSKGLGMELAQLLDTAPPSSGNPSRGGRRVVHRAGEGQLVETRSYRHHYLATELLNKQFTPLIGEANVRTMEEFFAEFGDFIRHPGDEFALVLDGEIEFHTESYAPLRLKKGDSVYFDSEMGHAYLKGCDDPCRMVVVCSAQVTENEMMESMVAVSERMGAAPEPLAAGGKFPAPVVKRAS